MITLTVTYIVLLGACLALGMAQFSKQYGAGIPDLRQKPLAQLGMGVAFVLTIALLMSITALLSLFGIREDWLGDQMNKR